jgi:predicted dehydrogenase
MEAMWARFVPWAGRLRELLADGTLGEVRQVIADHGGWFAPDASHRLFAPELGGGALLDLGVYPVSFASMVLGTPSRITAVSDPAFTGVDATTSMIMQYAGGAHAVLTTTLLAAGPTTAAVVGTDARVQVDGQFYTPTGFTLTRRDGTSERFEHSVDGRGMWCEAAEVVRCLRDGRLESDVMPLDETVAIMATMDEVRRQIGLTYPPT